MAFIALITVPFKISHATDMPPTACIHLKICIIIIPIIIAININGILLTAIDNKFHAFCANINAAVLPYIANIKNPIAPATPITIGSSVLQLAANILINSNSGCIAIIALFVAVVQICDHDIGVSENFPSISVAELNMAFLNTSAVIMPLFSQSFKEPSAPCTFLI